MNNNFFIEILKNRKNLKQKLLNKENIFAGWISYPEISIIETICNIGINLLAIDMEHTSISLEQAKDVIRTSQSMYVPCLPRPVSHSKDITKPLLDFGSDGMIYPIVENPNQVENIIKNFKFSPLGRRSFGVNRAQNYGLDFDSYINSWNDTSSLILQIESIEGVNNIDEILNFHEVDGVMIGPYDLSGSLNVPGDTDNILVKEASQKVINSCKIKNKTCGIQIRDVSTENIIKNLELGFNLIFLSSDLFALSNWAKQIKNNLLDV